MKHQNKKTMGIQALIAVSFTATSILCMTILGILMYQQFVRRYERMMEDSSSQVLGQTVLNLEDYLRNMRRVSDAMYYTVIKATDLAMGNVEEQMDLLYEANKDKLVSIACYYSGSGVLTSACPVSTGKSGVDVTQQDWFREAHEEPENFHYSAPHVQNLFDDASIRYDWVISLSRAVEITRNGVSNQGILLVDMNYNSIVQLLDKVNADTSGGYVYLMDPGGELIYHPRLNLIRSGVTAENSGEVLLHDDSSFRDHYNGDERIITVRTVAYTGWKLVRVIPMATFQTNILSTRYLLILLVALALLAILTVNQLISYRITMPLRKLDQSIEAWEAGERNPEIYVGGSAEVEHLGRTLQSTVGQVQQLMQDVVTEQEEKRKSELDALQSQINPHFLYNTLDSIVWMITGGRYEDAVYMVKQLASLFRISLSRGKTVISVEEELRHAQHYMNIQKIRYKNGFTVDFEVDESILGCCTVKLILQPILENSLYYGMEYMDDEGEIHVRGFREGEDVILEVRDNGPGMKEDEAALLLTDPERKPSRGSGVGLLNVHSRIRLRFGEHYGLEIETHPDEGMDVRIRLPDIPATKENLKLLEEGKRIEKVKEDVPQEASRKDG